MLRSPARLALALTLSTGLTAQVFVVDAAGGGHTRTIQAAVEASPSGTLILVRAGIHSESVSIRSKALRPLGEPGAEIRPVPGPTSHLSISIHPAGRHTVIALLVIGNGTESHPVPSVWICSPATARSVSTTCG